MVCSLIPLVLYYYCYHHLRPPPGFFPDPPALSQVKTRLAATVGKDAACYFYRECAESVLLAAARVPRCQLFVFYADAADAAGIDTWLADLFSQTCNTSPTPPTLHIVMCQEQSEDLGNRMVGALRTMSAAGHSRCLVVGSDIPGLTTGVMEQALSLLRIHDVVLGPAVDGGFYMVGTRAEVREGLFFGVTWSTDSVLTDTLKATSDAGLSATIDLAVLQDVDTVDDLRAFVAEDVVVDGGLGLVGRVGDSALVRACREVAAIMPPERPESSEMGAGEGTTLSGHAPHRGMV